MRADSTAVAAPDDEPTTMLEVLAARVAASPGATALVSGDRSHTYEELDRLTARLAGGLSRIGVAPGDTVAILMGNRAEYVLAWWAIARAGAAEVPVNTAYVGRLLAYILDHSESRVLILEGRYLDALAAVAGDLPRLETLVLTEPAAVPEELSGRRALTLGELLEAGDAPPPPEVAPGTPAAIMYTSGTTGPSKGAVLPHNYFVSMGAVNADQRGVGAGDVLYTCLPLFHGNAQLLTVMTGIVSGAPVVLGERFSLSGFWPELRRHGVTQFNYIGTILTLLMKAPPSDDDGRHGVRLAWGAGAQAEVWAAFERRFGVEVSEAYGMTENGMVLYTPRGAPRAGSCGKPIAVADVVVAGEDDRPVGPGVTGQLLTRPRRPLTMMLGYHRMPEQTLDAFRNLWFHTGDAAYADDDGYVYFVDRLKDAIRRRGENISSFEVEQVVNAHPDVLECAALPVPSELGEDEVMVCVALRDDGAGPTPAELVEFCRERMAAFMVPRYVRVVERLPKTPTERVEKYRLKAQGVTADTWDALAQAAPLEGSAP